MQIITGCLSEEEITGLKEMFKNIDKDNSGTNTLDELKNGLARHGTKLSDSATTDGSGEFSEYNLKIYSRLRRFIWKYPFSFLFI
jgi:Ca2+-binding EF-hand superfamily protein